jgi:hypothetical protein
MNSRNRIIRMRVLGHLARTSKSEPTYVRLYSFLKEENNSVVTYKLIRFEVLSKITASYVNVRYPSKVL